MRAFDDRDAVADAPDASDGVEVKTTVNGTEVATVVDPSRMLIDYLRDHLGLYGTKRSCDVQICGACTVLVDDRPVSSCCTPLVGAHGRSVTTIEGIADPASAHAETYQALEQSFLRAGAVQCGFCTPGLVTTLTYLIESGQLTTDTSERDLRTLLAGNLCRCTGYETIVAAARSAVRRASSTSSVLDAHAPPEAPGASRQARVGVSVPRVDAAEKCRGAARYLPDLVVPGMLHAKVVRSPVGHGTLVEVRAETALRDPEVRAVITASDVPTPGARFGHLLRDQPILATKRVRYVGEPVAIVVAESERAALRAASRVEVVVEEMPLVTLDNALDSDAPVLHPDPSATGFLVSANVRPQPSGNLCYRYRLERHDGNEQAGEAELSVEGEYELFGAYQYAMEPHGAVVQRTDGRLHIWSSCQHPFLVRQEIARLFSLDLDDVVITVPFVGGGFGSKSYTNIEPLAALAAWHCDVPVRLVNSVEDSMLTSRQHSMRCWMRTTADRSGRLRSREVRLSMDTGGYATNGPTVTFITGLVAPGPYRWDDVDVTADCVYTNRPPAGSYRGFGAAHTQWIGELQIDELADRAGLDRVEMRRSNLLRRGERVHPAMKPLDADLDAALTAAVAGLGRPAPQATGRHVGRGCGVAIVPAGAEAVANALVRLRSDGKATVLVGTSEIGQGARTVFSQIVSDVLSVNMEDVSVPGADTSVVPYDRSTGASRSTTLVGLAVKRACEDVVAQLTRVAARRWPEAARVREVVGRYVGVTASGEDCGAASLQEVLAMLGASGDAVIGRGRVGLEGDPAGFPVFWEACAAAATVAVDDATGAVSVLDVATSPDVGRALNPLLVAVQDSGCTLQALGQTLYEELDFSPQGELVTPSLVQYFVPTFEEAPDRASCTPLEHGDGPGPYGAKGCGEGPFGSVPAAVACALRDAGAKIRRLPASPAHVWAALHDGAPGAEDATS